MEFLRTLFARKTRSKGSEAVEEALAGFEEIIRDLNSALIETEEERVEALNALVKAGTERDRIEGILEKGENFISGLRALLQG